MKPQRYTECATSVKLKRLHGRSFTNASGRLFDAQGDGTIVNEFSGAGSSFSNAGTFRKSAGTGTLSLANGGYGRSEDSRVGDECGKRRRQMVTAASLA